MSYVIRCYEGEDQWGSKKWLAHLNLGNDLFMSFLRGTKKEAEDAARDWYERESKRFKHQDSCNMDGEGKKEDGCGDVPASNGWGSSGDHKMIGKVWMLNRTTGERTRIDGGLVAEYEGKGFVKAGPRSK